MDMAYRSPIVRAYESFTGVTAFPGQRPLRSAHRRSRLGAGSPFYQQLLNPLLTYHHRAGSTDVGDYIQRGFR